MPFTTWLSSLKKFASALLDSSSEEEWKPSCEESSSALEWSIFLHVPFCFFQMAAHCLFMPDNCVLLWKVHFYPCFELKKCFHRFSLASDAIEKQALLLEGLPCQLWNWSNLRNMNLLLEACSAGLRDKAISCLLPSYGNAIPWWEYSTSYLSHH